MVVLQRDLLSVYDNEVGFVKEKAPTHQEHMGLPGYRSLIQARADAASQGQDTMAHKKWRCSGPKRVLIGSER